MGRISTTIFEEDIKMSADLNTVIEMEGTLEEIMAMITVIKG